MRDGLRRFATRCWVLWRFGWPAWLVVIGICVLAGWGDWWRPVALIALIGLSVPIYMVSDRMTRRALAPAVPPSDEETPA